MSFLDKINNTIKRPYYYVPPCPSCGSPMTGRIIKRGKEADVDWAVVTALKNGEIIVPVDDPGIENACCLECDFAWSVPIEMSFETSEYISRQKDIRHTRDLLDDKMKGVREAKKNEKGLFLGLRRYIGKW